MRFLPLILALLSASAWSQAVPQPVGDERVRYAIGQTVRETIRTTQPAANDSAIDRTVQRIGQVMGDAANNPQYQANATRWAWIGFRLLQRANPYVSIALELCSWQGLCTANPKLNIIQVKEKDTVITKYHYDLPYPILSTGLVYYAGKQIPASAFTCGGTDAFILNAEYYFPGAGTPCRVHAGFPSAIAAHEQYLEKNYDYFGIGPGEYEYMFMPTMAQLLSTPAIVCTDIAGYQPPYGILLTDPYFPCLTQRLDLDSFVYYLAEGQPPTWFPTVKTLDGKSIKIVTDFPMSDIDLYPDAPEKGSIELYPWLQSLTATDLASAVSPAWISQVAAAAWLQAMQYPAFDGLPMPASGVSPFDADKARALLADEWPSIGDILDPIENNQTQPYYSKSNTKPARQYVFNWSCGFSNMPKCLFDFVVQGANSGLDLVGISHSPFDPLQVDPLAAPNNFSKFFNSRLVGASCSLHAVTATVSGSPRLFAWDFCRFAGVARDVLALLAYVTTAGVLFGGLRTARQDRNK